MTGNIILGYYFLKQNEKTLTPGPPGSDTPRLTCFTHYFPPFSQEHFLVVFCNAHFLPLLVRCSGLLYTANCLGKLSQEH